MIIGQTNSDAVKYAMHPLIEHAYGRTHDWFDSRNDMRRYQEWNTDHASVALARGTLVAAAFNFHYFFATHYFKVCHALQSDNIIGLNRLVAWLRYNPYITVIDVGCGDGAGSVAIIETILRLREKGQIDPRPIQICCVGVDPNLNGLSVYEKMLGELAAATIKSGIDVTYKICPRPVSQASGFVESFLFGIRRTWKHPSLNHTIVIESNLNDLLMAEHQKEQERLKGYSELLRTYSSEPFSHQLASFYNQLFEGAPIDHLHILSIDTEPDKIKSTVQEMLLSIEERFSDRGHMLEHSAVQLESITITNPSRGYWKKNKDISIREINPFVVSTCHIHNRELKRDDKWQKVTSRDNLELAWARARQEMLREAFSDEVEIRLFEQYLESNLQRLHFELDAYAIHAGYMRQTLPYATPKDSSKDRPRGLTWLEEEVLMIAIIQVVGAVALQQKPWSYAYRLSPENSPERGATEYLYERWSDAWATFRLEVGEYTKRHPNGVVIKTDIRSYFMRILHDRLNRLIKEELNTSKRIEWLLELLVSKDLVGHDPGRGLVQGSVGSGFLANLYLSPIDNLFQVNDSKGRRLFRYVDDIVAVVPDPIDEQATRDLLFDTITKGLHLEINPGKTDSYAVEQFLPLIASDETLDRLRDRFDEITRPLWWLNEQSRVRFKERSRTRSDWWADVSRYRSCLIELGLFIGHASLSRALSRGISGIEVISTVLEFPELPYESTIARAREWARQFKEANAGWINEINALRIELSKLFLESLAKLTTDSRLMPEHEATAVGRRLRFCANRLGFLGLDIVHKEITKLLSDQPWLVRHHQRLLEDLARQGYSSNVWNLVDCHNNGSREMSAYMRAVALRSVRFLPRLEIDEWQKLVDLMFIGDEVTKLMATETWLAISSRLDTFPFSDKIRERTRERLSAGSSLTRRLLKNYLLVLGRINSKEVIGLDIDLSSDPLLSNAYDVVIRDSVRDIFRDDEPDVLRLKYYSAKYDYFDDGNGGSP